MTVYLVSDNEFIVESRRTPLMSYFINNKNNARVSVLNFAGH